VISLKQLETVSLLVKFKAENMLQYREVSHCLYFKLLLRTIESKMVIF